MTVGALFGLGYHDEAEAFIEWLLHSTNLTQPRLLVMYAVYGKPVPEEQNLGWNGYRNSRPVRVGNGARNQLQLDVYGEATSAAAQLDEFNKKIDRSGASVLLGIGKYIAKRWRLPDRGIWEPRTADQHHTHSKVMCWVAMDKLIELRAIGLLNKFDVEPLKRVRDDIRREIENEAWNEQQKNAAVFGGREVDASLLLMAKHGFVPADSPRMRSTFERIRKSLELNRTALSIPK